VQLVGTAHGISLENLLMNPTLSDLVGGIESVTLSDEEARRRGTQKSVLERRAPPTFDVLIEILDRQRMAVHHDVSAAVDGLLRGHALAPEIRHRDDDGRVRIETPAQPPAEKRIPLTSMNRLPFDRRRNGGTGNGYIEQQANAGAPSRDEAKDAAQKFTQTVRIYPYGIGRGRLIQAAHNLGVPILVVDSLDQANTAVTLKNYYRKHPQPIAEAERRHIPVYVLRANTINQMEACLGDIFGLPIEMEDPVDRAIAETQEAIRRILAGSSSEELRPAGADIRRMQHEMVRAADLVSHSYGNEPRRRVRIFQG
jgi:hypothetical protein